MVVSNTPYNTNLISHISHIIFEVYYGGDGGRGMGVGGVGLGVVGNPRSPCFKLIFYLLHLKVC